jgi:FAD/FMN-containing dehydrogenase
MNTQNLKNLFHGKVILPGDSDYDEARQVFYGGFDKKPAVIVEVADSEDIKQAILLAGEHKLELAVRSGGHSVAGLCSSEGGIVIDLRMMRALEINEADKTVWAQTGLTAGELTAELDKHNFVLGFGDTGSVGIGGITLGGGVGFLARKFGLAIDNLLAAEIVTADGAVLQVDKHNHPDLFWALRGGGGNFGVVTKFKYKLHKLSACYGGILLLPATPEVIAGFVDIARNAPNELSTIANLMPAFPLPFVPEKFRGKVSLMIMMVYAGTPEEGEKAVAPIRALAEPFADMVKPMRYKDIFMPEDSSYHPTAVSRNMFVKDIDEQVAANALDWLDKLEAPMKVLQFRVLGGAVAQIATDATAYAHRDSAIMCNIASFYETSHEKQERQKWVEGFAEALYQGDSGAYANFLGPQEQSRVHDAYPAQTLHKLQKIKTTYDPENLFSMNLDITNPKGR